MANQILLAIFVAGYVVILVILAYIAIPSKSAWARFKDWLKGKEHN